MVYQYDIETKQEESFEERRKKMLSLLHHEWCDNPILCGGFRIDFSEFLVHKLLSERSRYEKELKEFRELLDRAESSECWGDCCEVSYGSIKIEFERVFGGEKNQ